MNKYDIIEYANRGALLRITGYQENEEGIIVSIGLGVRHPTKLDFLKAYLTLAIPAAMLARVTRFITGRKGTPLERFLMNYYYNMSVKLLAKDCE